LSGFPVFTKGVRDVFQSCVQRRRNLGAKILLATAASFAWLSTVDHKRIAVSACEKRNVVFISAVAKFVLDLARTFLLPSSPMTLAVGFATVG
jgi:hypothetical protein